MGKVNSLWNEIEAWINEYPHYGKTLTNMPLSLINKLDKTNCLKILENKELGFDSEEVYNIKRLPNFLKNDIEIAFHALQLNPNNFFELSDSLKKEISFHEFLINKNLNKQFNSIN